MATVPADGWVARYSGGVGRVVCWAVLQEEPCPNCGAPQQFMTGMVIMPRWDGGPLPAYAFIGDDDENCYGDFLGFEPPEGW